MSSSNIVKFFPNSEEFKSSLGAIEINKPLKLSIMFSRPQNYTDVFLVLTKDNEEDVFYPMEFVDTLQSGMVEFCVTITVTTSGLYFYNFVINTDTEQFYIGRGKDLNACFNKGARYQLTVYEPIYNPTDWLSGGLIYQIMVDRFFAVDRLKTKTGVKYRDDWFGVPEFRPDANGKIRNNDFFGGNLKGITKKLTYLKNLGVTCIYMNPIFEARSNHKYDTGNYRKIDSDFGTMADLADLIKKANKRGMKIMLDGVFSHTGDDSIYFNKYNHYDSVGAYQSKDSPYASWYKFSEFPDKYESWWGIDTIPNTDELDPSYSEFITGEEGIIRYYTRMGVSAWRLDVADELPTSFLEKVTRAAKIVNPEAIVLGEVWEDASNKIAYSVRKNYFNGKQLDSVTNYPIKETILRFVRCGDSETLANAVNHLLNNYPTYVVNQLMNLLGTHDTARLFTVLGDANGSIETREDRAKARVVDIDETIKRVRLATVLQYTLIGVPCLYYGDEAGLQGYEDPFNRRAYPWGRENKTLLKWFKLLGKIRRDERNIFADGAYKLLVSSDGVIAFSRNNGVEELIIIVNNSGKKFEYVLENYTDLITKKPYNNVISDKDCVILKKTKD